MNFCGRLFDVFGGVPSESIKGDRMVDGPWNLMNPSWRENFVRHDKNTNPGEDWCLFGTVGPEDRRCYKLYLDMVMGCWKWLDSTENRIDRRVGNK